MNAPEEVNTTNKKGGKSTSWFTFGRKPKKCKDYRMYWRQGVPVEVSKPKNFQSMNHVEIDPNSELGEYRSFILTIRIERSSWAMEGSAQIKQHF